MEPMSAMGGNCHYRGAVSQPTKATLILFSSTHRRRHLVCGSVMGRAPALFLPNANVPSAPTRQAMCQEQCRNLPSQPALPLA